MTLFIFTEEPSMKEALHNIIPKLGIDGRRIRIINFDGVGNMEKELPRQLSVVGGDENSRVLILRDNDNGDCHTHKARMKKLLLDAGLEGRSSVRIVCQMLEAWFIGDQAALEKSKHLNHPVPRRLQKCDPDNLQDPKGELRRLRNGYTEIRGAKAISPHLDINRNRSKSFTHTISALRSLV